MKILFFGWNGWGHVCPTLSLLNLLTEKNTVYYVNSPEFNSAVEATGVELINDKYMNMIYKFFEAGDGLLTRKSEAEFIDSVSGFYKNSDYLFMLADRVGKLITKIEPDVIIHDSCAHIMKYVCRNMDIPRVSLLTLFPIARDMLLSDEKLFSDLYNMKISTNAEKIISEIDSFAKENQKTTGYFYDFFDGFNTRGDLNLVFSSKEFQPKPESFDDSVVFIGNDLSYRKKREESFSLPEGYEKCILMSYGSKLSGMEENKNLYKSIIDRFAGSDYFFILVTGNDDLLKDVEIPDNFMISDRIPQLSVLEKADLFITHGGFNSVSEAILNSVPMIVIPQIADEYLAAEQIERLGLGKRLEPDSLDMEDLNEAIEEILNDPDFIERLKYVKETYERSSRDADITGILENLIMSKGE